MGKCQVNKGRANACRLCVFTFIIHQITTKNDITIFYSEDMNDKLIKKIHQGANFYLKIISQDFLSFERISVG